MATIDEQTRMTPGGNARHSLPVFKEALRATMGDLAGATTLPESNVDQPVDTITDTITDPTMDQTASDPATQEE